MRVGVIGIGIIGREVVGRLNKSEVSVSVFNRTSERISDLDPKKLRICHSPNELIEANSYILLTLSDKEAIDDVLSDTELDLSNKTVIQMGTISPAQSQELQERVRIAGGQYVESPILGSRREIQQKSIILLVGCPRDLFDKVLEFLKIFGDNVNYIGEVGQASALKLAMNQIIAMHAVGMSLSLGIIQKSQIDPDVFMNILKTSALYAPMFDKKLSNWLSNEYSNPNFPTKHLLKDVDLIEHHAESIGLHTDVIAAVKSTVKKSVAQGYGDQDYSAVFKTINKVLL